MKTAKDFQAEIHDLTTRMATYPDDRKGIAKFKKDEKQVILLRQLKILAEQNPSEDTVKKWINELENKIEIIWSRMPKIAETVHLSTVRKMKRKYAKEMGVDKMKIQLKNLNLLLKK